MPTSKQRFVFKKKMTVHGMVFYRLGILNSCHYVRGDVLACKIESFQIIPGMGLINKP